MSLLFMRQYAFNLLRDLRIRVLDSASIINFILVVSITLFLTSRHPASSMEESLFVHHSYK